MSKRVLYSVLIGGLGNQMFQVASAYGLSKKTNRDLALDPFYWTAGQGKHPNNYADTIFKHFSISEEPYSSNYPIIYVNEDGIREYRPDLIEILKEDSNFGLHGYWQSQKYFEEYKDELSELFEFPDESQARSSEEVCLNIRGGDYKGHGFHQVCNKRYYEEAMDFFKGKKIVVSTDDEEYVKDMFKNDSIDMEFLEKDLDESILIKEMSKFRNMIISNSSFAWWASYIGGPKDKKIVSPNRWYNDSGQRNDILDCREDFIKLKIK